MKLATAVAASLMLLPSAFAALVPRRNTPNFYLVLGTSLLPLRHSGGTTLSPFQGGPPTEFYLDGPNQLALDNGPSPVYIDFTNTGTTCGTSGQLRLGNPGTNKCAQSSGFYLASYEQNSQLGAQLVFNWAGGFYECGGGIINYSTSGAPSGCTATKLWTVPATQ